MQRMTNLKGMMWGAACGAVAASAYAPLQDLSTTAESLNLLAAVDTLAVIVPGLIAVVNVRLFILIATAYGAGIGYLLGRFPQRRRLVVTLLLLVHGLTLVFADFVAPTLWRFPF